MTDLIYRAPENPHSHHTAIVRQGPSYPVRYLVRSGCVGGRVLDFGCGHGADVKYLQAAHFEVTGYDPHYSPQPPQGQFDTILCTYVLNVLFPIEQSHVLMAVSELLAPNGAAYFTVRRDIARSGYRRHAVHKTQVYQCCVRLPYPTVLRVQHCEIYAYRPLWNFLGQTPAPDAGQPTCPFCHPRGRLSLLTESATVYAAHVPGSRQILIIPKLHTADVDALSPRMTQAMHLVTERVQSHLFPQIAPTHWHITRRGGQDEHAHLILSPISD